MGKKLHLLSKDGTETLCGRKAGAHLKIAEVSEAATCIRCIDKLGELNLVHYVDVGAENTFCGESAFGASISDQAARITCSICQDILQERWEDKQEEDFRKEQARDAEIVVHALRAGASESVCGVKILQEGTDHSVDALFSDIPADVTCPACRVGAAMEVAKDAGNPFTDDMMFTNWIRSMPPVLDEALTDHSFRRLVEITVGSYAKYVGLSHGEMLELNGKVLRQIDRT